MRIRKSVRALAVGAAAAGLVAGFSGSAQAQDGYTDGLFQQSTLVEFVNCGGEVQLGVSNSNGHEYARGGFTLNLSSRGLTCKGWLQRSTDGGAHWSTISGVHSGYGGVLAYTDYYYDGVGYLARVCVGDLLYDNSYSCGAGV